MFAKYKSKKNFRASWRTVDGGGALRAPPQKSRLKPRAAHAAPDRTVLRALGAQWQLSVSPSLDFFSSSY